MAPSLAWADAVGDTSSALQAAIVAYAADPSTTNAAAMQTALTAYDQAVASNATTTVSTATSVSTGQTISGATVIYVDTGGELTYSASGTNGGAIAANFGASLSIGSASADLSDAGAHSSVIFSGNSATGHGGAISTANNVTTTITDSSFSDNTAAGPGGAIFNLLGSTATIVDSSFSDNSASSAGAIYNNGTLTIAASSFSTDTATATSTLGGAISNGGNGTATIVDSSFSSNSGAAYGGAIYNDGLATITDSSFSGNTAGAYGGAIDNDNTATIAGTSFSSNTAGNGGAIANFRTVTITGGSFTSNSANSGGGAIYNASTMSTYGGSFYGNFADEGGAIYNEGTATIASGTFSGNSATSLGGAIYNRSGTVTITGSSFSGNSADYGGAIINYGAVTITDSSFSGNSAADGGGAIDNVTGTMTITRSSFSNNSTNDSGGAIAIGQSAAVTVADGSFSDNSAIYGGAISNFEGTATIVDSSFSNNSAGNYGGAIYDEGGTFNLNVSEGETSTFSGNTASGQASSIFIYGSGALNVSVASGGTLDMRDPMSGWTGGTIAITQTGDGTWKLGGDNVFTSSGSSYTTTFDVTAGTLYLYAAGEVSDATSTNSSAVVAAGAIQLDGSGSSFTLGNTATLVAAGNNSITTDGTIVLQNGATLRGGTAADNADFDGGAALISTGGNSSLTLTATGGVTLEGNLNVEAVAATDTFTLNADLADASGHTGSLTKIGAGTVVLTGDNTYTGLTMIETGTLALSGTGSISASSGVVDNGTFDISATANGTSVANLTGAGAVALGDRILTITNADGAFSGTISGTGALSISAGTTYTLSGNNTYSGGTSLLSGTLAVGSDTALGTGALAMSEGTTLDFAANGLSLANAIALSGDPTINVANGYAETFNGTVSDGTQAGDLVKTGAGTLILTALNSYTGTTTVEAGTLTVDGSIASSALTTIEAGATLAGTGTVGSTTIDSGGTLAPGRAGTIGTLTVNGDLTFEAGAIYAVDTMGSSSDLTRVSGSAILNGGTIVVSALDSSVSYQKDQTTTILTAGTGVSGSFTGATTSSAFLTTSLSYDADDVFLTVVQRASFETIAQTPNQYSTAVALDTLAQSGSSLALYNKLLALDAAGARSAYNALDGEIHASLKSGLIDDSRFVRTAVTGRLLSAFGETGGSSTAAVQQFKDGLALWGSGYGSWGRLGGGGGNAASIDRTAGGFLMGADKLIANSWRIGVMGGYGYSSYGVNDRDSSATVDQYTLGAYAGTKINDLGLHLGMANTWHAIDTSRAIVFPGFAETDKSSYDASTTQLFGDAGYTFHVGKTALEPFAGLAWVNLHTDGYDENGVAGLYGSGESENVTYTTLGLRGALPVSLGSVTGNLSGTLGWQHAFGNVTPSISQAFASSDAFTVTGVPIARDAALIQTGFDIFLTREATLGLAYTGQLGAYSEDNSLSARFHVSF
ncbi:MAG TPA: autotransporter domain-containing protein [Bradyrhizobium sp.]|nr:autotransporter domain-containing protein [Bradyrhizobium sp.]